jgi:peptidoglycan hydrolase FlgJ
MTTTASLSNYTDLQGLAGLKREARVDERAALRETARQFESLFIKMMLSSMREASEGDPIFDSDQSQMYRGMFDDQMSLELSAGRGIGLADALVEQLMRDRILSSPAPTVARAGPVEVSARTDGVAPLAIADRADGDATPGSKRAFLEAIRPAAEQAAKELGIAPRSLMAQAALETGWGRSMPRHDSGESGFNLFGIKAGRSWQGEVIKADTEEFVQGRSTRQIEAFRAYDSIEQSFADHTRLVSTSRRYQAALNTGEDTAAFAQALQQGGYATDPRYADKLVAVAQTVDRVLASAPESPRNQGVRL